MNSDSGRGASPRKNPPIQLGGRGVASWERDDPDSKAFNEWHDVSTTNLGRHNSSRDNTFNTPVSMHQKPKTPAGNDKRFGLGDTKCLQEICEMGFARSMSKLQSLILDDVKAELVQPLVDIHKRIGEARETEEKNGIKLSEMVAQVLKLQTDVKQPVDFAPIRDEMQEFRLAEAIRLDTQKDEMQKMEDRISLNVAEVLGEVQAMREKDLKQTQTVVIQEVRLEINGAFEKRYGVDELAKECDTHMNKILALQQTLYDGTVDNNMRLVQCVAESVQHNQLLTPTMATQLQGMKHLPGSFDRVIMQVRSTQDVLNQDTKIVLQELAKIQQALNVDFAHVLDDVRTGLEGVRDRQALEDDPLKNWGRTSSMPSMNWQSEDQAGDFPQNLDDDDGGGNMKKALSMGAQLAINPSESDDGDDGERSHEAKSGKVSLMEGGGAIRVTRKRFRQMHAQTDGNGVVEAASQTCSELMNPPKKKKKAAPKAKIQLDADGKLQKPGEKKNKAMFADAEEMKRRMREELIKPPYNVQDFYHERGIAQAIATNWYFDNFTLMVILFNALWIAIDTDHNDADTLLDAHPVFQIAENAFCGFFVFELTSRFLAFNGKKYACKDSWFCFDFALVSMMVIETWVIPGAMMAAGVDSSGGMGDASILRMVRMVRLVRVSRMVRLLKAIPELVILIKGIKAATRSVAVFFLLWTLIIYVFSIVFRQLTAGADIGEQYFDSVPEGMNTLFLDGILADFAVFVNNLSEGNGILFPIILFFIMLCSVTIMYMLVGVLVDVVGAIAAAEKEGLVVAGVAQDMRLAFEALGRDTEVGVTEFEFNSLLKEPLIYAIVSDSDVDVVALLETSSILFEDPAVAAEGLSFEKLIDLVLNLRGSSQATVKDMKELVRAMKKMINTSVDGLLTGVDKQFVTLRNEIQDLIEKKDDDEEDDAVDPSASMAMSSGAARSTAKAKMKGITE